MSSHLGGLGRMRACTVEAAESIRYASTSPSKFTPQQKDFADLLQKSQRNGNFHSPPFKVYFRSPEFGLEAIHTSDYLRWGTGFDARQTELVILLAARQWQSGYIWHAHYALGMKVRNSPSQ